MKMRSQTVVQPRASYLAVTIIYDNLGKIT